nr:glycosyltransferase [Kineobactrum sediminis]
MVRVHPALGRPEAPLCSVCIAHYQGPELIAACIDSVLQQDCEFTVEIIVHDDASPDESVDFLRANYPQVELLASKENVGFCVSNKRMVAHARGKYILLLNNDAALFSDALTTLAREAEQQNPPGILTLPQYDWESGDLVDRGCLLDPFYNPVPNLDPERRDVAMVIGACLWIERETWDRLGGFPEWFGSVGEDLYLCCAARLWALPVEAIPESGYRHRQGHSFGGNKPKDGRLSSSYNRRIMSERNKTFTLYVMTPTALVWPLLIIHLLLLTVEGLALSVLRLNFSVASRIYFNVYRELFGNLNQLRHKRQIFQNNKNGLLRDYFGTSTVIPHKLSMLRRYGVPKINVGAKS